MSDNRALEHFSSLLSDDNIEVSAQTILNIGKMAKRLGLEGIRQIDPGFTEKEYQVVTRISEEFGRVELKTVDLDAVAEIAFSLALAGEE